jgi:hypothetical protein
MRFFVMCGIAAAIATVTPSFVASAQAVLLSPEGAEIERRLRESEQGYDIAGWRLVIGQTLAEDGKAHHTFPVQRGRTYFSLALCDDACGDIDLIVKDAAGNVLDNDEAKGADPGLLFRADVAGAVEVVVSMKACDEDACEYGLGFHTLRGNGGRN